MNVIQKYFREIIILILIIIILLQQSCKHDCSVIKSEIKSKIDTTWIIKHDTIAKIVPIKSVSYPRLPKSVVTESGTTLDSCQSHFKSLLKEYQKQTIYSDIICLDVDGKEVGEITVNDTVWMNKLGKRTYFRNYKIPEITKTITITNNIQEEAHRQLYIGTALFANKTGIQSITPGVLYKTKKDQIYSLNVNVDLNGGVSYGAGIFWKIKLK